MTKDNVIDGVIYPDAIPEPLPADVCEICDDPEACRKANVCGNFGCDLT